MSQSTLKLALTPGDPAGIGLDILLALAQQPQQHELVAYADASLLQARAESLGLPIKLVPHDPSRPANTPSLGQLSLANVGCDVAVEAGVACPESAQYMLRCIEQAVDACQRGDCSALVTGPVNKNTINRGLQLAASAAVNTATNTSEVLFSGHTEYLASLCGVDEVLMLLAVESAPAFALPLRVALLTTHLPLSAVPAAITAPRLRRCIEILSAELAAKYALANPRITVLGLNPHAGENGDMGCEERDIINPCLDSLRADGYNVSAALPADTAFTPEIIAKSDAFLAMYHDQGLAPLKSHGFGQAVNVTLGLPIIRTSVDHGTAYDLAASGRAQSGSLQCAVDAAAAMALRQRR